MGISEDNQQESEQLDRAPVDLICVIDRSGSMNWDNKWTNLVSTMDDLVGFLQPADRLCLISYNSAGTRDTALIRMNENGQLKIKQTMQRLGPGGSTNIGSGLNL